MNSGTRVSIDITSYITGDGAVNLALTPGGLVARCKINALSAGPQCRSFDACADGYVCGEGCGIVVLKRLEDARADGSAIQALVLGTAINSDGRTSSLTAPSAPAQARVLRAALASAGVSADDVDYLEAHLLDFEGDLYGRRVRVFFERLLRHEVRFPNPQALARQIRLDIARAERHFQGSR